MTTLKLHDTLDNFLLKTRLGETFTGGLAGSSVLLDALGYITPVIAFIGATLALVAGWYTMRLKKHEYEKATKEDV